MSGLRDRDAYNEYMRKYMLERYHQRRAAAIIRLGGQCIDCGATENLEFDHADSGTKSIEMAKVWSYAEERFLAELAKCVLRCHPCHIEKSRQFDWHRVDHGGGVSGKNGCKCDPCRLKKNEYMRAWKRAKRLAASSRQDGNGAFTPG